MSALKYYIIYKADLTQDIMDRCHKTSPYELDTNLAETKVILPFAPNKIPVSFYSSSYDVFTKDELDEYVADADNGFVAVDQETFTDNKHYSLDGVSKSFNAALNIGGAEKFTISLWVDADWITSRSEYYYGMYIDNSNRLGLTRSGDRLYFNLMDGATTGQVYYKPELRVGLYNLIVVYDGTETASLDRIKYYIDGEYRALVGTGSPSSVPAFTNLDLCIGTDRPSGGNYSLADFRQMSVWNDRALTSSELSDVYNAGTPCDTRELTPSNTFWFGDSSTDDTTQVTDLMGNVDLTCNNIAAGDINDN